MGWRCKPPRLPRFCAPTNTHPSHHRTRLCFQTSQPQLQEPHRSLCKCRSGSRRNPQRRFSEAMPSRRWQPHEKGPVKHIGHSEISCLLRRLRGTAHFPEVKLCPGEHEFFQPTRNGELRTLSWPAECFSLAIGSLITFVSRFGPEGTHWQTRGQEERNDLFQPPWGFHHVQ